MEIPLVLCAEQHVSMSTSSNPHFQPSSCFIDIQVTSQQIHTQSRTESAFTTNGPAQRKDCQPFMNTCYTFHIRSTKHTTVLKMVIRYMLQGYKILVGIIRTAVKTSLTYTVHVWSTKQTRNTNTSSSCLDPV